MRYSRNTYSMYPPLVFIFLQCCRFLPPPFSLISQFTLSPLSLSGVLSQFTLILWGTGPSVINSSSSYFPRPSNNSCKTFDAQQICIGETVSQHTHTLWTGAMSEHTLICICAGTQLLLQNRLLVRLCWAFQLVKSECCEYRSPNLQASRASVYTCTLKMHIAICHISLNQSVERMEEQQGKI